MEWNFDNPLKAKRAFRQGDRWFEIGDPVDWQALGLTLRQVQKLFHKGYLENGQGSTDKSDSQGTNQPGSKKNQADNAKYNGNPSGRDSKGHKLGQNKLDSGDRSRAREPGRESRERRSGSGSSGSGSSSSSS